VRLRRLSPGAGGQHAGAQARRRQGVAPVSTYCPAAVTVHSAF
jgi:hypothetical protein